MHNKKMLHKVWLYVFCTLLICAGTVSAALNDKEQHFIASAGFGAGAETILHYKTKISTGRRIFYASVLGLIPGIIKETIDEADAGNEFSGADLGADALGSLTGAIVSSAFNSVVKIELSGQSDRLFKISVNWDF